MSSKVDQLLVLAAHLEKVAGDVEQPETFGDDYENWLHMKSRKDSPATVREMKAVRPEVLLEEEVGSPKVHQGLKQRFLNHIGYVPKENESAEMAFERLRGENPNLFPVPRATESFWDAIRDVVERSEKQDADTYIRTASRFEQLAVELLVQAAEKKEKKKLDPKAKVRNRGTVCVPASSAKDKKDHFPINDADQARNALARVHQYDKVPPWYGGSLKSLQELVSRKVHSKYPAIGKEKSSKKKSSLEVSDKLFSKYGQ